MPIGIWFPSTGRTACGSHHPGHKVPKRNGDEVCHWQVHMCVQGHRFQRILILHRKPLICVEGNTNIPKHNLWLTSSWVLAITIVSYFSVYLLLQSPVFSGVARGWSGFVWGCRAVQSQKISSPQSITSCILGALEAFLGFLFSLGQGRGGGW